MHTFARSYTHTCVRTCIATRTCGCAHAVWAQDEYVDEPINDADLAAKEGFAQSVRAAYSAIIAPLTDEERRLVEEAGEEAQRIIEAAGPLMGLADASAEVKEACAWLQKHAPSYLKKFHDQPAAHAFCAAFLAETPLLVALIRDRTQEVSLETVAPATGDTGIYVVDTRVPRKRAEALTRASRVGRVVATKLRSTSRAENVDIRYTGQSVDNERRMREHADPNSAQFCDEAARCLEATCGAVTSVHELATVNAVARLAGQAGLTVAEGLNIAEAVVAHVLRTMTAEGGLNVADPGCVGVATSVSAAGGRVTSGARGRYGFGEQTAPWFRLGKMVCLAAHEIVGRCHFLAYDAAMAVAHTLPLGKLCEKHGESQLLDLAGRLGVADTDAVSVLHSMLTRKGGGCPSHAMRDQSHARARGIRPANLLGRACVAFDSAVCCGRRVARCGGLSQSARLPSRWAA